MKPPETATIPRNTPAAPIKDGYDDDKTMNGC